MNNLMIFENKPVEIFEWNGQALFNPYHVGECLELGDSAVRMAISKMNERQVIKLTNSNVKDIDFRKLHNTGENFLTESGVYKLIFKSHKEEAEKFQDWVTDEVLPSIRKTGSYDSKPIGILESLQTELQSTRQELAELKQVVFAKERKKLSKKEKQLGISSPMLERISLIPDEEILEIIKIAMENGLLRELDEGIAVDKRIMLEEAEKRHIAKSILNKKLLLMSVVVPNKDNYAYKQVRQEGSAHWCYVIKNVVNE